jgi:hypothetical protein
MTKEEALAAIGARIRATGFLRIAGCVLVYFWARGWVNYGVQGFSPEGAERIDLGFDTMPLILLPTVVAFWSDGIGMTILFLFGASVVSFFSPFAVALPLFLQTGPLQPSVLIEAAAISWPVAFCVLIGIWRMTSIKEEEARDRQKQHEEAKRQQEQRRREEEARDRQKQHEEAKRQQEARRECKWWEVLGISPEATLADAQKAYRLMMRQYHPDKVAGLGPELIQLAEQKSRELNAALDQAKQQACH